MLNAGTMNSSAVSRTSSTSSSPDVLSPLPKKRKAESITSVSDPDEPAYTALKSPAAKQELPELFEENIIAKIVRTAATTLNNPSVFSSPTGVPLGYPETVPQTGPNAGQYEFRDPEFWTCGFFPGSLYALLERSVKHPQRIPVTSGLSGAGVKVQDIRAQLRSLSKSWSKSLHSMAFRTDTHDIGFIVMPALKRDWELFGSEQSLRSIVQAARSLATRYVPTARAIRSWDCLVKKEITVIDQTQNVLVIIDSLCNLDLLFYAAAHTGDESLSDLAAAHAQTLLTTHLRPENNIPVPKNGYRGQLYSTCHVANIDPATGDMKWRWTAQGYENESTWARGQAWAILGYAQTYMWTQDTTFLDAACGSAEYFLHRLEASPSCVETEIEPPSRYTLTAGSKKVKRTKGRLVPLWDFDAPVDPSDPLRDSSAGVIAANGMVILFQALTSLGQDSLARRFLDAAFDIVQDTLDLCLATEKAHLSHDGKGITGEDSAFGFTFDSILKSGTANNNQNARRRYCNHGLVYGDYYLIEFGNRLLDLGLV
ncbi:Six-hairpin glycosidase-like protein [Aspergillus karnatakaensis]|uniref:Six-hairpin glycosidase-like protein n=1 Tax=Aspergillus karnatakaensis TaxID=1810916 RepID=UPI003CCDEC40